MKKQLLTLSFTVSVLFVSAQTYLPFEQVRKYTKAQTANKYDSSLKHLTNRLGAGIHYLYPLYQGLGWESRFKTSMGEQRFNESFSELLSFVGDYSQALNFRLKNYIPISQDAVDHIIDTIGKLKDIESIDAKAAILGNAPHYRVMMINESHAKPVHRAFVYTLLEGLYKDGYRYLAMEALNNLSNRSPESLNVFTGYFTNEPVAGELVRKALELGYKLIPYEDTLADKHSLSQRDSVQAANLAIVFKKDPSAKMLVLAGNAHIAEEKIGDYTPMARWFRQMTNLDPFTIEQTGMTEGSEFEYGRIFYEQFVKRYAIASPSVIFQGKRHFNPLDEKGYDISIVHPPTQYRNNRPTWLSFEEERKLTLIQPTEKMLFFVQAYYATEYDADNLSLLVPADQTYITNREGYYPLYLKKGKYKIVLRDVSYKMLSTKDLEVL